MKYYLSITIAILCSLTVSARSNKRGIGWDEGSQRMNATALRLLQPGVAWIYNWSIRPQTELTGLRTEGGITFVPMCWNDWFDESALRTYLTAHPETRYLLGFNEPNFADQAAMTPQKAAEAWPKLERIAEDFGLRLVAPALNFSATEVGGRVWGIYEWLDAFIEAYPTAHFDCLALHGYMNWASAIKWYATEMFYKDLYDRTKTDVYGKYPHLVQYFDTYGKKPMMLTEFCAWNYDEYPWNLTEDFQIDQMTQKVQYLEQSDMVEGYAWFMANGRDNVNTSPFFRVFSNLTNTRLSDLGMVYVYMSDFDTSRYYAVGDTIAAKDYVDASTDDQAVRLRPTSDAEAVAPIDIAALPKNGFATYQIEVPADGTYHLQLRANTLESAANVRFRTKVDGRVVGGICTLKPTAGEWQTLDYPITLKAGQHTLELSNYASNDLRLNWLRIYDETMVGIEQLDMYDGQRTKGERVDVWYDLSGRQVARPDKGFYIHKVVKPEGRQQSETIYLH